MLLALLAIVPGCQHKQSITIMVITPTGGLEYWENFFHAARVNALANGIHIELSAPQSVTDYTEQAQMVDNAISRHVQGIIVSPAHQLVLTSVLQKAVRAHIPVVLVGTPIALANKDYSSYVAWNEVEAAKLAARRLVTILGGKGEVGVIGVSPTVEESSSIEKAFAAEIARTSRVKLVSVKYGLSDWARSHQAIVDLLAEHPKIGGIFTTDEFSTHAAAYTFNAGKARRPYLIGISNEANELDGILAGRTDALIVSDPQELALRAMQQMKAALDGRDPAAYSSVLPVFLVDKQTLMENPIASAALKRSEANR